MKYSLQCKYSMVQQTFMFIIKSLDNADYDFTWLIGNIEKPIYVLTNNNIVFKAEVEDDFVVFSVAKSAKKLNQQLIKTMTVPILTFETDQPQLEILYDYDHMPTQKEIIIGKIINEFIVVGGGGFLEDVQDYNQLEQNISIILDEFSKQNKTKKTTKQNKKEQQIVIDTVNAQEQIVEEEKKQNKKATVKKNKGKKSVNTEQVTAKTTVKRNKKTTKKD